jgi:hypothetical protein
VSDSTNETPKGSTTDLSGSVEVLADPDGIQDPELTGSNAWTDKASEALSEYVKEKQMTFREALERYDIVDVVHDPAHGSYVVMAEPERGKRLADSDVMETQSFPEMGYSSPSPYLSWTRFEHNPKLIGQLGLREYYRMKRSDGTVRGSLRQLKTPIQAGHWFVEPHDDKTRNKNAADFVWENLSCYLNVSWARLLDDILLMTDYGYMAFEIVWNEPYGPHDVVRDGKLRLQKLAPRHPMDIRSWDYDKNGGPNGIVMEANPAAAQDGPIPIPIEKLVVFSHEAEAGDLSGISVLRSAWKHYFYKDTLYKIDAIQKERHGIGIPVIKLPPGWSTKDLATADALGRNLRVNERSHIVLPPLWDIIFAQLGGHPVDCMKSIDHHDKQIAWNIIAPNAPTEDAKLDMFLKSTRYIASLVCDTINKHVIPKLIDANFSRVKYPYLRARRIGEWEDIRTMSFALRNLVGADLIRPDDPTETYLRKEMDMPPMDPKTTRNPLSVQVARGQFPTAGAPGDITSQEGNVQAPGTTNAPKAPKAGLPRQKALPPSGVPKKNAGGDRSGGR